MTPFWQRHSVRIFAARALTYALLFALSVLFILPFAWALSASFKKIDGVYAFPPQWIPEIVHWENYVKAVTVLPFHVFLKNSLLITLSCLIGQVFTSSLVAYSFARLRWWGRDVCFIVLLATMMLPGQVTMIPVFILFSKLGWVGSLKPLIVPAYFGGGAFFIFLMRQFFKTIPLELEDAAKIDGCAHFQIYWRVMLPLSKPVLATVALLSFIQHWQQFMEPLIYLSDVEQYTLQMGLRMFQSMYGSFVHYLMAASILVLLPLLVLFFLAQKYFVRGIILSGIKG
jgi:ABC-type glycerol-3-phosphate transport system permease component